MWKIYDTILAQSCDLTDLGLRIYRLSFSQRDKCLSAKRRDARRFDYYQRAALSTRWLWWLSLLGQLLTWIAAGSIWRTIGRSIWKSASKRSRSPILSKTMNIVTVNAARSYCPAPPLNRETITAGKQSRKAQTKSGNEYFPTNCRTCVISNDKRQGVSPFLILYLTRNNTAGSRRRASPHVLIKSQLSAANCIRQASTR